MAHPTGPVDDGAAGWAVDHEWDLAARQLQAIAAFHHARAIAAWAAAAGERSREMRAQDARRLEVLRRKHSAVIARAHEQLRSSGVRPTAAPRRRVLLAGPGSDREVAPTLEAHGLRVVARVRNGADAVGIALVEQPDVVVVHEPLAMVPSEEVVREVRRYSPGTGILVVAGSRERASACADAGATLVLTGELTTPDLVRHLLRVVEQRQSEQP